MLSMKYFIVLHFTFRSVIHFELIFVRGLVLSVLECYYWFSFFNKNRPSQIVHFFLWEFLQIVFQRIVPFHLGYQICGHRVVHSIYLFFHMFIGSVVMSIFISVISNLYLFFFYVSHASKIIRYLFFSLWLTSLSIISRSIHVAADGNISFCLVA